jgi:hypothetical protein
MKNTLLRFLLFITINIVLLSYYSLSNTNITVRDTVFDRLSTHTIPVYANFDSSNILKLDITFIYNSNIIDIQSIKSDNNTVINCTQPTITKKFDKLDSATIEIKCDSIISTNTILCYFEIEALVCPDSIGYICPSNLIINDTLQKNPTLVSGKIQIPPTFTNKDYPEGLGYNYPNPFYYSTDFHFSINRSTKVEFTIFSLSGRDLFNNLSLGKECILKKITDQGYIYISTLDSALERGNYILTFTPIFMEFPTGLYFFNLKTENNSYNNNFMFIK